MSHTNRSLRRPIHDLLRRRRALAATCDHYHNHHVRYLLARPTNNKADLALSEKIWYHRSLRTLVAPENFATTTLIFYSHTTLTGSRFAPFELWYQLVGILRTQPVFTWTLRTHKERYRIIERIRFNHTRNLYISTLNYDTVVKLFPLP